MVVSMLSGVSALLAQAPTTQELADKLALDSQILSEQFYYYTVVIMWLIHVGFMSYEAGAGRRKNVMATAMKNILTIAVGRRRSTTSAGGSTAVSTRGCIPSSRATSPTPCARANRHGELCSTASVGDPRPEPERPHLRRLLGRIPPLLLDDGVDLSGALIERVRLGLPHPRLDPSGPVI
jgi:hypothetical protein